MAPGGQMKNWIFVVLGVSLFAVFSSQSLVDISDLLVVGTAFWLAYKKKEWTKLWTSFKPGWIWPIWLVIIAIGLILNTDLHSKATWEDFLEFRWILTLLSWIYILRQISDHKKTFDDLGTILLSLNSIAFSIWLLDMNERAGGILGSIMSFAHNIAPIFCIYVILLITNWKTSTEKEKRFYAAVAISSGILVVTTFTRGVWIGSAFALMTATFIWNKKMFAGVIGSLIFVFLIGISTSKRFSDRVFTKTSNEKVSNQERTALWRGNWEMVKEYPIFGVGLGANKRHLRKYYDIFGYPEKQRQSHAHNQYLQYWAGTGTLGLMCFLLFISRVLNYSYQGFKKSENFYLKNLQLALLSALICFLIGALTESNFNIAKNRFLFLMLAGMAVAWSQTKTEKNQ
jgi:O-antigen ligase